MSGGSGWRPYWKEKNLWSLVVEKSDPKVFLATIGERAYTEAQLWEEKQQVQSGITLSIKNNLLGIVPQHNNPANL